MIRGDRDEAAVETLGNAVRDLAQHLETVIF